MLNINTNLGSCFSDPRRAVCFGNKVNLFIGLVIGIKWHFETNIWNANFDVSRQFHITNAWYIWFILYQ